MTFDALETGLKFDEFSWLPWGSPGSKVYACWVVTMPVPRRTVNSQIASSTMQDRQCNINHAGIKGYEKARMQNERNRGHWIQDRGNSSQPGGPSKEGPADFTHPLAIIGGFSSLKVLNEDEQTVGACANATCTMGQPNLAADIGLPHVCGRE